MHVGVVALGQLGGLCFANKLFHTDYLDGGSMARVLSSTGSRTHSAFDSAELEFTARATLPAEPWRCSPAWEAFPWPSCSQSRLRARVPWEGGGGGYNGRQQALGGHWGVCTEAILRTQKGDQLPLSCGQRAAGPAPRHHARVGRASKSKVGEALRGPENLGWGVGKLFLRLYSGAPQPR